MTPRPEWVLLALLLSGCTGQLVDRLNERQVSSCIWWSGPLGFSRGITATGGATMHECVAVPCMRP